MSGVIAPDAAFEMTQSEKSTSTGLKGPVIFPLITTTASCPVETMSLLFVLNLCF